MLPTPGPLSAAFDVGVVRAEGAVAPRSSITNSTGTARAPISDSSRAWRRLRASAYRGIVVVVLVVVAGMLSHRPPRTPPGCPSAGPRRSKRFPQEQEAGRRAIVASIPELQRQGGAASAGSLTVFLLAALPRCMGNSRFVDRLPRRSRSRRRFFHTVADKIFGRWR
jgi:hypothetical protein